MARLFDGTDDDIRFSSGIDLTATDWSLSMWVRPTSFPATHIGIMGVFSGTESHSVTINNGNLMVTLLNVEDASAVASPTPALNVWSHVGVDYTDAGNGIRYFVNGKAAGTAGIVSNPTAGQLTNAFGTRANDLFWVGALAEGAIWTSKLDASDYAALASGMLRPNQVSPSTLQVYYAMCPLSLTVEPDLSGNSRTGTPTGTTAFSHPLNSDICFPRRDDMTRYPRPVLRTLT